MREHFALILIEIAYSSSCKKTTEISLSNVPSFHQLGSRLNCELQREGAGDLIKFDTDQ